MPRLETKTKFWFGELTGDGIDMRWGDLGSHGRSARIAGDRAKLDALIAQRHAEGFVQVDRFGPYAPIARWTRRYAAAIGTLELTLDGRVVYLRRDDEPLERVVHRNDEDARDIAERLAKAAVQRGLVLVGETEPIAVTEPLAASSDPELAAMCRLAPDDPAPWAVYADWLMSRGDVRGELAALIGADAGVERTVALRHALFAGRAELADRVEISQYRFGFPIAIELKTLQWREQLHTTVADVLALPVFELLERLVVAAPQGDVAAIFDAIATSPHAATLRELDLVAVGSYRDDKPIVAVERLGGLVALRIATRIGDHPTLRSLAIDLSAHAGIESLVAAQLPSLERLDVTTRSTVGIAALLDRGDLPALRHLGLLQWTEPQIGALASSPLLRQLRSLDLGNLPLSVRAGRQLVAAAAKFRHLDKLVVGRHAGDRIARVLPNVTVRADR